MVDSLENEAWLESTETVYTPVGESLSIGRASSNGLVLPVKGVSRCHAIIHARSGNEFWLVDLGSRNGTWVNGRRILHPICLHDADRITMGASDLTFRQAPGMERTLRTQMSMTIALNETRELPFWLLITDIENFTGLSQELPGQRLADLVARWLQLCQEAVARGGGRINKFLGDGFFAVWEDVPASEKKVLLSMEELAAISARGEPAFRTVVHRGTVSVGGSPLLAEESFIGSAVNFAFRMEKLAGTLALPLLFSEPAASRLSPWLPMRQLPSQQLKGFDGSHNFYTSDKAAQGEDVGSRAT
jgi:adenylate cyclase